MIARSVVLVTVIALASVAAHAQTSTPDATVRSFYAYSNARSSTFNRRHVELRKRWYTPELYNAFLNQLRQDDAFLKKNPTDKPYFGDGLTLRPLDEPCTVGDRDYKRAQSIGRTEIVKTRATVEVSFAYPKACTLGLRPIVYQVNLHRVGGRWLIDDWIYDGKSSLKADMTKQKYD